MCSCFLCVCLKLESYTSLKKQNKTKTPKFIAATEGIRLSLGSTLLKLHLFFFTEKSYLL